METRQKAGKDRGEVRLEGDPIITGLVSPKEVTT